jgi:hypothetical protein
MVVPNLDEMTANELRSFCKRYARASDQDVFQLTGSTTDGAREAVRGLVRYAKQKASAIDMRLAGHLQSAMSLEGKCDQIFRSLPPRFRW